MAYGEAVRRSFAVLFSSHTSNLPGAGPRGSAASHARARTTRPRLSLRLTSRVPGLSQLLLRFAAGATSKGCGHPGVERRGSAGRWGAVGRRGHRGLDVGKHCPTSAKGRRGGTKQVSLSRVFGAHTPLRRGIWMDQMTSRARPPSSDSPEFCAPPRLRHPRNP